MSHSHPHPRNWDGKAKGPPQTLAVYKTLRRSSSSLSFDDRFYRATFGVRGDLSYLEGALIPPLIPRHEGRALQGTELGLGFNSAKLIQNYTEYKDIKEKGFFKWLLDYKPFWFEKGRGQGRGQGRGRFPYDFISFGGRVSGTLQTPLLPNGGAWELLAAKYNDSIFLWEEHKEPGKGPDLPSFYGVAFEALLTGKDPLTVNEHEKTFLVQGLSFGQHRLLLLNETDSVEEDEDLVEIKAFQYANEEKYFKFWAQCVVPGFDVIILGQRGAKGRLNSITFADLDYLQWKANLSDRNVAEAYDFEDRLLCWISSHFRGRGNDPFFVKRFTWRGDESPVVTSETLGKGDYQKFFPDWFINP